MPFAFVRPRDAALLGGRPLLDVGCGDGQTALAVAGNDSFGIDRSHEALRSARLSGLSRVARADTLALPFASNAFGVVLAADLLHHIGDLDVAFAEMVRVLRPDGLLVAWWYEGAPHDAPDAPRFPRSFDDVAGHAPFDDVQPLDLEITIGGGPPTVGLVAKR